jgi:hypothetical protein
MLHLFLVSLLWAVSFGLIKHLSGGGIDGTFLSATRLGLALLVFLPFLRLRGLAPRTALTLAGIGAVQFGVMYLAYNESFRFLLSHEVALLTLTTPIFVTLLADALDRTLRARALLAAVLAVLGNVHVGAVVGGQARKHRAQSAPQVWLQAQRRRLQVIAQQWRERMRVTDRQRGQQRLGIRQPWRRTRLTQPVYLGVDGGGRKPTGAEGQHPVEDVAAQHRSEFLAATGAECRATVQREGHIATEFRGHRVKIAAGDA